MKNIVYNQKVFVKKIGIYSIGTIGTKVISFILLPIYTFFLTKEEIGYYDLILTISNLLVYIYSLLISDATYRWLIDSSSNRARKEIISTSLLLLTLIITFLFGITYFILDIYFYDLKFKNETLCLIFLNCYMALFQSIMRGMEYIKLYSFSSILNILLIAVINISYILFFKIDLSIVLYATIFSLGLNILFVGYAIKIWRNCEISSFDISLSKNFLRYSIPLIPNYILLWVLSSANKFIILDNLGIEYGAIYSIALRFAMILSIINTTIILPIQDFILKSGFNNNMLKKYFLFEVFIAFILSILSPIYLYFFVSQEYYNAWVYIPFIIFGVVFDFLSSVLGIVYQKNKKNIKIMVSTLWGSISSILLSVFFVKYWGLYGISIAYLVGFCIVFSYRYIDLIFKDGLELLSSKEFIFLALMIGTIIPIYMIQSYNIKLYYIILVSIFNIFIYFKIYIKNTWIKIKR